MTDPIDELIALGKKAGNAPTIEFSDAERLAFAARDALPAIEGMKAVVEAAKVYYAARDARLYAKGQKEIARKVHALKEADGALCAALSRLEEGA